MNSQVFIMEGADSEKWYIVVGIDKMMPYECHYAMLCYAMLCYAMLCYAMLCYAMLCYAMLCYAMLCYSLRLHYMKKMLKL